MKTRKTAIQIWDKIKSCSLIDNITGCWSYRSPHVGFNSKAIRSHRFSWFYNFGEFPSGQIYHICENFKCVNPEHLYIPEGDESYKKYFFYHIHKQPDSGCWYWLGSKDKKGYGLIPMKGRSERAHRYSYRVFKGIIPSGYQILHQCDNPSCVNPSHLDVGTNTDNMVDKFSKNRQAKGKLLSDACKKGWAHKKTA
jgi:hypothetical protein